MAVQKLTTAQLIELVQLAGLKGAEHVADDAADPEYSADAALKSIDDARVGFHRPGIVKEVEEAASTAAAGKYGGILRHNLAKATGLSATELSKLGSDAEVINFVVGKLKEGQSEDAKAMQENIIKERNARQEEINTLKQQYESEIKAAKDKYYDREIQSWAAAGLKDAPLPSTSDRDAIAALYLADLRRRGELQYDEAGKTVSVIGPDKLPAKNRAGNNNFDLKEDFEAFARPLGLWTKDTRDTNPVDQLNQQSGNQNNNNSQRPQFSDGDPLKNAQQAIFTAPALQG